MARMATSSAAVDELTKLVADLSVETTQFSGCYPNNNPLDIYKAHIAKILHGITGAEHKIVYGALQWTTGLDKGDFMLAAPALRLKGKKPDELAAEWAEKVSFMIASSSFFFPY
jgi:arginyl-tRNA synthetase